MFFSNVKEIDAQELSQWMEDTSKKFRIIDVREPMEIAQASIPGAEPMPMSVLGSRLGEIDLGSTRRFRTAFWRRLGFRGRMGN